MYPWRVPLPGGVLERCAAPHVRLARGLVTRLLVRVTPEKRTQVERISHGDRLLAIVLRAGGSEPGGSEPGTHFVTDRDAPLQLGEMSHPAGHVIAPHEHNRGRHLISATYEVLHVRSGTLQVDLYAGGTSPVATCRLTAGDTILLMDGAHGFTFLTACRVLEVKQGPYLAAGDKTYL